MVPNPNGANGYWGSDWLGSSTVAANGGIAKYIGISAGAYNLKWVYTGGNTYSITSAAYFYKGDPRTLQLSDNVLYANIAPGPNGSISTEQTDLQIRPAVE